MDRCEQAKGSKHMEKNIWKKKESRKKEFDERDDRPSIPSINYSGHRTILQ